MQNCNISKKSGNNSQNRISINNDIMNKSRKNQDNSELLKNLEILKKNV